MVFILQKYTLEKGKEREKSDEPQSLFELKGSSVILLESPRRDPKKERIQEDFAPSFELERHQGVDNLQIRDGDLVNMESELRAPNPGDVLSMLLALKL